MQHESMNEWRKGELISRAAMDFNGNGNGNGNSNSI